MYAKSRFDRRGQGCVLVLGALLLTFVGGCAALMQETDRDVHALIRARQSAALGQQVPVDVNAPAELPDAPSQAYEYAPHPRDPDLPPSFEPLATQPQATQPTTANVEMQVPEAVQGQALRAEPFTLTRALRYAQQHRREYQAAKEDLYLVALALTLERHLWTPIFASNLRTVYGNFGEDQDFDQAMRFVADLSVAQRLPLGGEVTASAISTLVRDVGQSITAEEGSEIELGLRVPLLRGAGHVAREELIQLERDLTYAVRTFERFRRRQLVIVAQEYFDLLRVKQRVIDNEASLERADRDVERAQAVEDSGLGDPLDTLRAKQRLFSAEASLASAREALRSQLDDFKLTIGMPIDEPLSREDLQTIDEIERAVRDGKYPLLVPPPAADQQTLAVEVALRRRFDLLSASDRIDDARRGVSNSRNAMLPDLNWNSTLTFDTDPEHFRLGDFSFDRANWRSELILSLPLERTAERNALRRALIDVRAAHRNRFDLAERIRADVRSAVNQLRLQVVTLRIQQQNLEVARRRSEYAQIRFEEGEITNRDKIEAEAELLDAQNALNRAKTSRWAALLEFRLETETLVIDEAGRQYAADELPAP